MLYNSLETLKLNNIEKIDIFFRTKINFGFQPFGTSLILFFFPILIIFHCINYLMIMNIELKKNNDKNR